MSQGCAPEMFRPGKQPESTSKEKLLQLNQKKIDIKVLGMLNPNALTLSFHALYEYLPLANQKK